jgi:hypothetical protein
MLRFAHQTLSETSCCPPWTSSIKAPTSRSFAVRTIRSLYAGGTLR